MTYVVSQPQSLSNPTDDYQVILLVDWIKWYNGGLSKVPVRASFSSYQEAADCRDKLNVTPNTSIESPFS